MGTVKIDCGGKRSQKCQQQDPHSLYDSFLGLIRLCTLTPIKLSFYSYSYVSVPEYLFFKTKY